MIVSLLILPGTGQQDVTLDAGATLQDLANAKNLQGRQLVLNGATVPSNQWDSTYLSSGDEIGALATVKGA